MKEGMPNDHLLRTKLHRPRIPVDFVVRPRLVEILERGRNASLILVSAPAGYGKSVLISGWLEQCDCASTWLSLDEGDSNLQVFLSYFLAAIRELIPRACPRTQTLLHGSELPPVATIARELVSEITAIERPFVLVLDDYGRIHNQDIHDLLSFLLDQRLRTLHLVLITRRDPPLPLTTLRADGALTEIRMSDLRMTTHETTAFLEKAAKIAVDDETIAQLYDKTEGWVVGLRMVALALRDRRDAADFLRDIKGDIRHIQEYLVSEVLTRQHPEIRAGLLKTSILPRFSARLCEHLCGPEITGDNFIHTLEESNLFCIALDERREWFRYHHLFQDLLQQMLQRRYESGEIELLHKRASAWFEEQGLLDESLHHALKCCETADAEQLIMRHRHDLMNQEQWHHLRRWIRLLPRETVDRNPELLMVEAWLHIGWPEMADIMGQIEALLPAQPGDSAEAKGLQGEWETLRGLVHYHMTEAQQAIDCLQRAVKELPWHYASERGLAVMVLSLSYQMMGDLKKARSVAFTALKARHDRNSTYRGRVLLTFCFMDYMEADLSGVIQASKETLRLGQESGLSEITAHGYYFLGTASYARNDLAAAKRLLQPVVEGPYITNSHNFAFSAFALALVFQAEDQPDQARGVVNGVFNHALQINNISLLQTVQAFQAELDIRQGRIPEAGLWARTFDPDPFTVAYRFYVPQMTLAKWYLVQDTPEGCRHAADLLFRLHEFFSSTNNTSLLIEVLILQALLHDAQGDRPSTLSVLKQAIDLAEPARFIRVFVDQGPKLAGLVQQLARQNGSGDYIRQLLTAFGGRDQGTDFDMSDIETVPASSTGTDALVIPLTNRETEVLGLMAKRLRTKEIAEKLFLSPETVKKHTINIYQKLDVHGSREAVARAHALGIL